jgi:uncharacterized protein YecE (DUF72 family)
MTDRGSSSTALPGEVEVRRWAERAPRPARWRNVLFGTAGWTDPSLIKSHAFYPSGVSKPEPRLRHYAQHFSMVEVDAGFYTILSSQVSEHWLQWTPGDFCFDVKVHASMTGHSTDLTRLPRALREQAQRSLGEVPRVRGSELPGELRVALEAGFERFVEPLRRADRLGCLMFQFPPWFEATRGNARRLERIRERWQNFPVSIEFRHASWLHPERKQRVRDLLSGLRFSYVIVDEPQVRGGGVPPDALVTQPELAIFRFHGHNVAGWHRGASVEQRFNYLYSVSELRGWREPIQRVAGKAARVHVVFNNCVRDFAVVNARGLSALLLQARGEPPE